MEGEPQGKSNLQTYKEVAGVFLKTYKDLPGKLEEIKNQPVPSEVLDAHQEYKQIIEEIYGRDEPANILYHGTGNLQYAGNKYGSGDKEGLTHPLDSILGEGINPQFDIWNMSEGGSVSSSFATTWPYGKAYADIHQDPIDPLKWSFGTSSDWLAYILVDTGRTLLRNAVELKHPVRTVQNLADMKRKLSTFTNKKTQGKSELGKLQQWMSYVRHVDPNDSVKDILHSTTDIRGNFGAVITFDPEKVKFGDGGPKVYEVRTHENVSPHDFKAITVPMNKVIQVKKMLQDAGFGFPVLPTEAVDYHMSRFSLQQLTRNRKLPF